MCLAVPGRIESLEERDGTTMSVVNFGGVRKEIGRASCRERVL